MAAVALWAFGVCDLVIQAQTPLIGVLQELHEFKNICKLVWKRSQSLKEQFVCSRCLGAKVSVFYRLSHFKLGRH